MHGPQVGVCRVCGELTSVHSNAACMQCGSSFHLALRQDIPGKDCGQVWINDESQTLDFACNICLGVAEPQPEDTAAPSADRPRYTRATTTRASDLLRQRRRRRGP